MFTTTLLIWSVTQFFLNKKTQKNLPLPARIVVQEKQQIEANVYYTSNLVSPVVDHRVVEIPREKARFDLLQNVVRARTACALRRVRYEVKVCV